MSDFAEALGYFFWTSSWGKPVTLIVGLAIGLTVAYCGVRRCRRGGSGDTSTGTSGARAVGSSCFKPSSPGANPSRQLLDEYTRLAELASADYDMIGQALVALNEDSSAAMNDVQREISAMRAKSKETRHQPPTPEHQRLLARTDRVTMTWQQLQKYMTEFPQLPGGKLRNSDISGTIAAAERHRSEVMQAAEALLQVSRHDLDLLIANLKQLRQVSADVKASKSV